MEIKVSNQIYVTNPRPEVVDYCRNKLILNNPVYEKNARLGYSNWKVPRHIYLYSVQGNTYLIPYGALTDIIAFYKPDEDEISTEFVKMWEAGYEADIPLYDYQELAVEKMRKSGHGILKAPAGSGKTQMGIALICQYGGRALWITHTQDLLQQSYNRAKKYISDESLLGKITEGKINASNGITFATVQTLAKIDLDYWKDYWDVIVVDECHRCSGSPTVLTQFYKVLNSLKARHKFGLSATVHRSDGMIQATYSLLGAVKYEVPEAAVGDKIVPVGIKPVSTDIAISYECLNEDGTLNYAGMINYLAACEDRNILITDDIIHNKEHPSLILSERLVHLETLMEMLPEELKNQAAMIHGKMQTKKGKAEREQAIQDMRDGKKKYLFATYSLAKEGLDIPCLERLYMATPVKDYAVVVQSVGRIARCCEGKDKPICYDYVDNIGYLKKAYKKRWSSYKKCNCYEVTE